MYNTENHLKNMPPCSLFSIFFTCQHINITWFLFSSIEKLQVIEVVDFSTFFRGAGLLICYFVCTLTFISLICIVLYFETPVISLCFLPQEKKHKCEKNKCMFLQKNFSYCILWLEEGFSFVLGDKSCFPWSGCALSIAFAL
jgi:hypothetical protein